MNTKACAGTVTVPLKSLIETSEIALALARNAVEDDMSRLREIQMNLPVRSTRDMVEFQLTAERFTRNTVYYQKIAEVLAHLYLADPAKCEEPRDLDVPVDVKI